MTQSIADKIRNGLIQHVSVGADYDALDVVDAKIPHGLSKPELSLVAVPGIPETNIQVLEQLKESLAHHDHGHGKVKLKAKEALGEADVFCVFCSSPADYFVSICQPCVDKFSVPAANSLGVESLDEKEMDLIAEKVALKVGEINSLEVEKLKTEQSEAQKKITEAESARDEVNDKLAAANRAAEEMRKQLPGGGLLTNPPATILVSEHISVLEKLLPPVMVERSSMGMQRQGQAVRSAILQAKEKLEAK